MITEIDNLVNAAVQKNNTIERLIIANKALTESLADRDVECARLLTIITSLFSGRVASGGSSDSSDDRSGGGGDDEKPQWDPDEYFWIHG